MTRQPFTATPNAAAASALKNRKRVLEATGLQQDAARLQHAALIIGKRNGRDAGLPLRPCFPFMGKGKMNELAAKKIRRVAFAKLVQLLRS